MAEKEPEKDKPEEISPRRGAIELIQVISVVLIPVGWLLRFNPWLTGAAWALAVALFWWPFRLVKAEVEKAEVEKARAEAERTAAGTTLRSVEAKPPGQGLAVTPYHSRHADAEVYHIFADCHVGNDIEPENWTPGDGGKTLCKICEGMTRGREKPAA